jgi:hypothetical protein
MVEQPAAPLRSPEKVMRLKRLGSLHQCRLSFMRILVRRMVSDQWQFQRPIFDIDRDGTGHAVYSAIAPGHTYSLIAFAHNLPDELRSDRVIAEAWDATFCLFDGVPTAADIQRLKKNVPVQEAGRISERELTLSRANRSVRLWKHVVDALAAGTQPDVEQLNQVGYLMRTTAVYGSGKFGAADREVIADRPEMHAPFQAEMLTVYLIRTFVRDLVQHMASVQGGSQAVNLDDALAQQLGIGNSTGLGMAPFIVNHPVLFNNWIMARETAIARVRAVQLITETQWSDFNEVLMNMSVSLTRWHSDHPVQMRKLDDLHSDLERVFKHLELFDFQADYPWDRLVQWCEETLSEEGQECLFSLVLEPYAHLVDDLVNDLADSETQTFSIDGSMTVGETRALIERSFGWACKLDWQNREHCARAWYVSEEKLEPRLGERFEEPVEAYEQPLAPARDAAAAQRIMCDWPDHKPIAEFLLQYPEHRHTVRRAQLSACAPYAEILDNTISASMLPIDMLRAKLSFFGAGRFDPRSDRWVRICMYAGAPYPNELNESCSDRWVYH